MHTVCLIKAVMVKDIVSSLLFLWWGPGFFSFCCYVYHVKLRSIKMNWAPFGLITSYACKLNYIIFMGIYYYFDLYQIMFAFSVWIMMDQINLDGLGMRIERAERLRLYWLLRLLYIGLLFAPIFYNTQMPYRFINLIFGCALFLVWIISLLKVYRKGLFFQRPEGYDFLRNIIYLSSRYKKRNIS